MKRPGTVALALCLVAASQARAEQPVARGAGSFRPTLSSMAFGDTADLAVDLFANFIAFAAEAALLSDAVLSTPAPAEAPSLDETRLEVIDRRANRDSYDDPQGWRTTRRTRRDARQGFLFSFGLGGSGLHVTPRQGTGALDFDLRMGYGFSDRFQLFGDLAVEGGQYNDGTSISSWTLTARGQTVLIGDRDGNGLNVNGGIGMGGVSRSVCGGACFNSGFAGSEGSSPIGLAAGAGLSYDARLGHSFRLSPEFFVNWHQVPNDNGKAADIATAVGFRLNFLWYVQ